MLEQGKSLFFRYAKRVKSQQHWMEILNQKYALIDYKQYSLVDFTPQTAIQIYQNQLQKYTHNKYFLKARRWSTLERKLFAFFTVIYAFSETSFASKIVESFDFELISKIFFWKSITSLKFCLYNILKNHDKVIWTQTQDSYLSIAVKKNKQIKWDNVSIDIFFNTNGTLFIKSKQCKSRWLSFFLRNIKKSLLCSDRKLDILNYFQKQGKLISKFQHSKETIYANKMLFFQKQNVKKSHVSNLGSKISETKLQTCFYQQDEQAQQQQRQKASKVQQVLQQRQPSQITYQNNTVYPFSQFDYQMQICNYNTDLYQMHKDICALFQPNFALIFPQHSLSELYPKNVWF